VHPPSEYPKSEVSIVCGIAKATLLGGLIDWSAFEENYDLIRYALHANMLSLRRLGGISSLFFNTST
jgi:hypothetical protein